MSTNETRTLPTGWHTLEVLVTVKAYPNPSRKYVEASCMAGITRDRRWVRLYPIPHRMLESERQFSKYTWIRVQAIRAREDHRPESLKVNIDSIQPLETVGTEDDWAERCRLLLPLKDSSMCALRHTQPKTNRSLGLIRPREVIAFEIEPTSAQWTPEQQAVLSQQGFWDRSPARTLEKIPYNFYYRYVCEATDCPGHRMKVVDWELHQSYRKWRDQYGDDWEQKLRDRYVDWMLRERDLHFFVGTMLKHPQSWIIIGLFYPPKQRQLRLL